MADDAKVAFVVSGGTIFYFFVDDIVKIHSAKDVLNETVGHLEVKRAFLINFHLFPIQASQGMGLTTVNFVVQVRNLELFFEGYGELPEGSAIVKSMREEITGIKSF